VDSVTTKDSSHIVDEGTHPPLPESSDALAGVREFSAVCSASTWISSVSSVLFRSAAAAAAAAEAEAEAAALLWFSPLRPPRVLLRAWPLRCSLGSLRSRRSKAEDSTSRERERSRLVLASFPSGTGYWHLGRFKLRRWWPHACDPCGEASQLISF